MKGQSKRRNRNACGKVKSPRVAIVPAASELRLGSIPTENAMTLLTVAQNIANELARLLPEKGLVTELASKNPNVPPKRYVKVDGWTIAGAMLGVNPIEESCERVAEINGYKAVVRLERICDGKTVGRASAVCSFNEPATELIGMEEHATYSKTITRATGKAFRLTYGWLMKIAGFEGTPAEELYEVEGSETASEDVARRKIEEKLGQKFESLAHAEAALMDQKQAKKEERATAKRSVFITWPEAHKGLRFLVTGRLLIWENDLAREVEGVCGGIWSDTESGWFVSALHAPYIRHKISEKRIPIIETGWPEGKSA